MVGDAEVDAVESFTKDGWDGRMGPVGISEDTRQTNPAHPYLIFVLYFAKLLTVK